MKDKLRTRAARLVLMATGILLTSTVGHTAARMMAAGMAQGRAGLAFQLAVLIGVVLAAAFIAVSVRTRALKHSDTPGNVAEHTAPPKSTDVEALMQAAPTLSPLQITQLRLPAGMRLDSNDALLIMSGDAQPKIIHANPAFARLTGIDAREWVGRSGDLLQADGPLRMESLLWLDSEEDGREMHWIARMHRRDGTPFCAEAHLHPMPSRSGGIGHVVLVMVDVTQRVGSGKPRGTVAMDAAADLRETRKSA